MSIEYPEDINKISEQEIDEMSNSKGTKERCQICGLRKRGSNHDNGEHHQKALKAKEK